MPCNFNDIKKIPRKLLNYTKIPCNFKYLDKMALQPVVASFSIGRGWGGNLRICHVRQKTWQKCRITWWYIWSRGIFTNFTEVIIKQLQCVLIISSNLKGIFLNLPKTLISLCKTICRKPYQQIACRHRALTEGIRIPFDIVFLCYWAQNFNFGLSIRRHSRQLLHHLTKHSIKEKVRDIMWILNFNFLKK